MFLPPAALAHLLRLLRGTPLWLFLATFAIQAIPFNPVPNYIPIAVYIAYNIRRPEDVALAVLSAAAGAALGKAVVLMLGDRARAIMPPSSRNALKYVLDRTAEARLDLLIFAVAASPLPDDELYIVLSATGYSRRRVLAVVAPAKILWSLFHVLYAVATYRVIKLIIGDVNLWTYSAIFSAVTLSLTLLALRMDWDSVVKAYYAGGVRSAAKAALRSAMYALWRRPSH
nr:MAG: membrane protein [Thermoproteus sp. AZ2]